MELPPEIINNLKAASCEDTNGGASIMCTDEDAKCKDTMKNPWSRTDEDAKCKDTVENPLSRTDEDAKCKDTVKRLWSRPEILELISLYEENEGKFNSSTMRNSQVWHMIGEKLQRPGDQCAHEFKYLKGRYLKKKENMGSGDTGNKRFKFDYFDEFDRLFNKKPNVEPIAVASSSAGVKNVTNVISIKKDNSVSIYILL